MALYDPTQAIAERTRRGWSIADVAERSAIAAPYLRDFEQGLRWLPPAYAARLETTLQSDSAAASRNLLPVGHSAVCLATR